MTKTNNSPGCVRIDHRELCQLLNKAKVPADHKWSALVLYLRSLEHNEVLNTDQKAAIQALLVDVLKEQDFSEQRYRSIGRSQEQIIAAPYQERLQGVIKESATLIQEFGDLLKQRRGNVEELGEFSVQTLTSGLPPDEAVVKLRDAFRSLVEIMDEDARNLVVVANTDALTGLANRRALDDYLQTKIEEAGRDSSPLSVLMVDIDWFKNINDQYGHGVGDQILKFVVKHMALAAEPSDGGEVFCARYGGEEFAIVLPGLKQAQAATIAEAIRKRLEQVAFEVRTSKGKTLPDPINCTVSIGVCELDATWGEDSMSCLLGGADDAMYEAKRSGRNRVALFSDIDCTGA